MNLNDNPRGGTMCITKAGLAIGDGAKTGPCIASPVGAGVDFAIDGRLYHKADAGTVLPLTAATAQAVSTSCLYLIQVDSSLAVTSVKGREVLTADITAGNDVLEWPEPAVDKCPIGAVRVDTDSAHTFTPGTTALDAAGITETYYDLMTVPINPLTA
ncbi:MAG: hypothetical protein WC657_09025 [Candidatus Paceibacterota bacterium]|jgi:hypothetical protein